MSAIKSAVILEEERQQQRLVEQIAQEKTKQLQYQLDSAKHQTLAERYKADQSSINADIEGVKVGIAYEVLTQNHHRLTASEYQTGQEWESAAMAHDTRQAASVERRLKQRVLTEKMRSLHLQGESASCANSSAFETLKTASGRVPNMRVISVG